MRGLASLCAVLALLWPLEGVYSDRNVTVVQLGQLTNPRATQARQARVMENSAVKAEYRSMHSEESQHVIEEGLVHDLKTPRIADENVTSTEQDTKPDQISRRMDVETVVLPPKEIKSKTLHFNKQDNGTVVLYRPRNRSRQGYQRSRILVQKPTGGRNREVHKGKSLFYDSSTELLGMADDQSPVVVPVVSKVLPDVKCANRSCATKSDVDKPAEFLSNLANMTELSGLALLSKLANLSYLFNASIQSAAASSPPTPHPTTSSAVSSERTTPRQVRIAGSRFAQADNFDTPVVENATSEVEGRNRASSARSLFKLLEAVGGGVGGVGGSSPQTSANATGQGDKESKMSPFRFGLQQLFTPRLPMTYPQMLGYTPQYPVLYPTRAPLFPLYAANGLIPTITTRAPQTTAPSSAAPLVAVPEPRKSCSGECIDVFAALMCGQVDEEAHCELSSQRCCTKGAEQVSKFLKRHGSVTKSKKSKKVKKNRPKESSSNRETTTPRPKDTSLEDGLKIEIEEDHKQPDLHRIFVHSSTTTTKRPHMHIAAGNGIYHVIGSKDVFSTRYPEIPKYVTIVTTTRKPVKQHATRRMDDAASTLIQESSEVDDPLDEAESAPNRKYPQNLNDAELEMIESNVHETEIPYEESSPMKQTNDTQPNNAIETVPEAPPCPGNCVLPIFSFFCDTQHKTSHVCPVGRVCCVGASAVDDQKNNTRVEEDTTNNNAVQEDDRHEHNCVGRCVPVFFQYTCKHPLRITDDICPTGTLCCTGIGKKDEEDDDEFQQEAENQHEDTAKDPGQDAAQSQQDAAEAAKKKLNLLHSILTTVLSTKKPKVTPEASTKRKKRPDESMQTEEAQLRPTYIQEPKYFPASEQLASEESADPAEVVIEPAIPPSLPAVDTRFSQLERPPMVTMPFAYRRPPHEGHAVHPSMRHRKKYFGPGRIPPEQDEMVEPHYPMRSRFPRPHPYMNTPHRFRTMPSSQQAYGGSEEMNVAEENINNTPADNTEETPIDEERENLDDTGQESTGSDGYQINHHHETAVPDSERHEMLQLPTSHEEVTEVRNFTSPFLAEWAPVDLNVARVKEVNSANFTIEERPAEDSKGGVHPSSCGLNGFHIKRWHSKNEANPGEWCWQAAIVDGDDRFLCSGAVIGAQWIATAASCVANYSASSPPNLRAKIGYVNMAAGPVGSQTKTVSMIYSHHNFNAQSRENDIALLKLHDFIDLNGVVCVICLPSTLRPETAMEGCTLTAYRQESASKLKLTYDRLNKLDPQVCSDLASLHNSTAESSAGQRTKFCAGKIDFAERTGACDVSNLGPDRRAIVGVGNPLVCRVDNFYQLSGISSTYLGCEELATPSYFTNLAYFTGWINQITNVNRYS